MINAFHRQDGVVRKRVAWVKALASIFTLGTGGVGRPRGPDDADRRRARLDCAARLLRRRRRASGAS